MPGNDEFVVTPYEVRGRVDYDRLRELFGTQEITVDLLDRLRRLAGGELHPLLARGIYYTHRDLPTLLDAFEAGRPFFLYSGRGPSGPLVVSGSERFAVTRTGEPWRQSLDDHAESRDSEGVRVWPT